MQNLKNRSPKLFFMSMRSILNSKTIFPVIAIGLYAWLFFGKLPKFINDNDLAMELGTAFYDDKSDLFYKQFKEAFIKSVDKNPAKSTYASAIETSAYFTYPIHNITILMTKISSDSYFIKNIQSIIYSSSCVLFAVVVAFLALLYLIKGKEGTALFGILSLFLAFTILCQKYFKEIHFPTRESGTLLLFAALGIAFSVFIEKKKIFCRAPLKYCIVFLLSGLCFIFTKGELTCLIWGGLCAGFLLLNMSLQRSLFLATALSLSVNQWFFWVSPLPIARAGLYFAATCLMSLMLSSKNKNYLWFCLILPLFHMPISSLILICFSVCAFIVFRNIKYALTPLAVAALIILFTNTFHTGLVSNKAAFGQVVEIKNIIFEKSNLFILTGLFAFSLTSVLKIEKKDQACLFLLFVGTFLFILKDSLNRCGINLYTNGYFMLSTLELYLAPFLFTSIVFYILIETIKNTHLRESKAANFGCLLLVLSCVLVLFAKTSNNWYPISKEKINEIKIGSENDQKSLFNDSEYVFHPNASPQSPIIWYYLLKYKINKHKLGNCIFKIKTQID